MLRIRGSIGDWPVDLTLELDDADWARLGAQLQVSTPEAEASAAPARPVNQDDTQWQIAKDLLRKARANERAGFAGAAGRVDRQRGVGQAAAGAFAPLRGCEGRERRRYAAIPLGGRSRLAGESGVSGSINAECDGLFAGKPAPTGRGFEELEPRFPQYSAANNLRRYVVTSG